MGHSLSTETVTRAMLAMPWDVAPAPAIETVREAAVRLKVQETWLRHRAKSRGLLGRGPVGRPPKGVTVGLTPDEWNAAVAPKVRRFVSVGSLEAETLRDWRTVLARCHAMGVAVFVYAPGQRAKYSVGATDARRVVASLSAEAALARTHVPLTRAAKACGYPRPTFRRMLASQGCPIQRSEGARLREWVDMTAAREAVERAVLAEREARRATRGRPRKTPPVAGRESTRQARTRHGVPLSTLRRWLVKSGVPMLRANRRKAWLDPEEVDRVVKAHRAQVAR